MNLKVILASTRPGRKGAGVADWVMEQARKISEFNTELLDLAVINLPLLDEPAHPRFKKYTREHTWKWSRIIDEADAFVFVTAEYNSGMPAPLKNAIDFLYQEWAYKPVAFVSYGGISGGTRSVQMLKQVVTTVKMVPMVEAVYLPFFAKQLDSSDRFLATDGNNTAAAGMFEELLNWSRTLKSMRQARS